jgi:predicted esterase
MTDDRLDFQHLWVPPQQPGLPTVLLLHGTGGDENDLLPLGATLMPGAGMLAPRGKVLEGDMPRYFRRLAMGVFDLDDLRLRTHELVEFVAAASDAYSFDRDRVLAIGYSNGANIVVSVLVSYPGVLMGAVLLHALLPFQPEEQPHLPGVPVFLSGGQRDALIPPSETERLADVLRGAGADLSLYWAPGGHELTQPEVEAARRWCDALAAPPTP